MHPMHSIEGIWVHVLTPGVNNKGLEPYFYREGKRNSLAIYQVFCFMFLLCYFILLTTHKDETFSPSHDVDKETQNQIW